jgi:hypothetical protein
MSESKLNEEQRWGHDLAHRDTFRNLSNSSYLVNGGKLTSQGEAWLDSYLKKPGADIANLSPVMQKEAEKKLKGK